MGWKERESMERLEEYLRWKLGDRRIPRYMIRGELQRDKKRGMAGRRAWGYEKRLKSGKGNEITRMCSEIRERKTKEKVGSSWEEERKNFFEDRGGRERGRGGRRVVWESSESGEGDTKKGKMGEN